MNYASLKLTAVAAAVLLMSGCAATQMAIEHKNLDVQSKMSSTIFLKPIPSAEHTIYVQIKNTSDKNIDIAAVTKGIDDMLVGKGYTIVPFDQAHYLLQANILQIGKMDPSAAAYALNAGFGGAVAGAVVAGTTGSGGQGMAGAALLGGVADIVANSLVKNVTYSAITDIQITEGAGLYKTRMLSTANQVNLAFADAEPKLQGQIIKEIAGIF